MLSNQTQAQAPVYEWAKLTAKNAIQTSLGVDASGNVYISGTFTGTADFDPNVGNTNLTSSSTGTGTDLYVQKIDATGNLLWVKSIAKIAVYEMKVDASGNSYVTGYFNNTADFDPNSGITNLMSNGSADYYVLKLDPNGNLLWAKSGGSASFDAGTGITIDVNGNVYTVGSIYGTADVDPGTNVHTIGQTNKTSQFILKLDMNGNFVYANEKTALGNATLSSYKKSIVIDQSGTAYIAGKFQGSVSFSPTTTLTSVTSNASDIFIEKLDVNGNIVWAKNEGGTGNESLSALLLDASGNICITGNFAQTVDFDFGVGTTTLIGSANGQSFIQKIDANANLLWVKDLSFGITPYSASTDAANNIYVCGAFANSADFDPNSGVSNLTSSGGLQDYFIFKLDANSNFAWAYKFGAGDNDYGEDISVDNPSNIIVSGTFINTVDFDPDLGTTQVLTTPTNSSYYFIHKLDQNIATNVSSLINSNDLIVYPNPSSHYWNIELHTNSPSTIELIDVSGKVLWSYNEPVNSAQAIIIPNKHLTAGVYSLKIIFENRVEVHKLIKN